MTQYEVYNSRNDVEERLYCIFQESSDEKALEKFEEYKKEKSLAWDYLRLVKVVRERVATQLASREP